MIEMQEILQSNRAGKYLSFRLGVDEYGIDILKVKTIIGIIDINKIPGTPAYVRGVINLRNQVLPVIDMRVKFGLAQADSSKDTSIIVLEIRHGELIQEIGIVVDSVSEVMDIDRSEVEEIPVFGDSFDNPFIMGVAKSKGRVLSLLSIEELLSEDDLEIMANLKKKSGK